MKYRIAAFHYSKYRNEAQFGLLNKGLGWIGSKVGVGMDLAGKKLMDISVQASKEHPLIAMRVGAMYPGVELRNAAKYASDDPVGMGKQAVGLLGKVGLGAAGVAGVAGAGYYAGYKANPNRVNVDNQVQG